jgi:murein DD-endopeptidase MepM/ murein hydrolase activator NlpD
LLKTLSTLLLCVFLVGCVTPKDAPDSPGSPVLFDPLPQKTIQMHSLNDMRLRRFAPEDTYNPTEWTREPSIWPTEQAVSKVISRFGPRGRSRKLHKGIDIKAPKGTLVVATADGEISFSGRQSGYGNYIEINHGDGITSHYGHFDRIFVEVGDVVRQGSTIGTVGATGNASTPHVHYEVRIDGQPYDPWLFLPAVTP